MNQQITNFKKPVNSSFNERRYKVEAIRDFANHVAKYRSHIENSNSRITWVPSSKLKTNPLYDDRHIRLLRLAVDPKYIIEVVRKVKPMTAMHDQI